MSVKEHKADAPDSIALGIITVTTSRSLAEDESGRWIKETAIKEGHEIKFHQVVPDDTEKIEKTLLEGLHQSVQAILITGGTGISGKDLTIEAIRPMFDKELTAFGSLFALLSFKEIDSAALLSRATAGVMGKTVLFCMPGSLNACKLACQQLIFPELGHLVRHMEKG